MISDKHNSYGLITKILHHTIALLMGFQFLKLFEHFNEKKNFISSNLPPWHGSIGLILGVLIALRVIWSITQLRNRKSEGKAAKAGHIAMYIFMVLTPISAILFMFGKGYSIKFFGNTIYNMNGTNSELMMLGNLHSPISIILLILVLGHIAIGLFHGLVKQDHVLKKMF